MYSIINVLCDERAKRWWTDVWRKGPASSQFALMNAFARNISTYCNVQNWQFTTFLLCIHTAYTAVNRFDIRIIFQFVIDVRLKKQLKKQLKKTMGHLKSKGNLKDYMFMHWCQCPWSRDFLTKHSISGKQSNAFKSKQTKPQLDPEKVQSTFMLCYVNLIILNSQLYIQFNLFYLTFDIFQNNSDQWH